jgi:hypothetical protein
VYPLDLDGARKRAIQRAAAGDDMHNAEFFVRRDCVRHDAAVQRDHELRGVRMKPGVALVVGDTHQKLGRKLRRGFEI